MQPRLHRGAARAAALGKIAALTLLGAAAWACKGREAECRARCEKFGMTPGGEECTVMCTKSCDALEKTFGISEAQCRAFQTGDDRAVR